MNTLNPTHNVFVYGTLKKRFPNHPVLHAGKAELVGHGTTTDKFLLFNGSFPKMARMPNVPANVADLSSVLLGHVWGEVWRVDDVSLMNCDRLEGHPHFYCREKVGIKLDGGDRRTTAWAYIIVDFPGYDVPSLMEPKDGILTWDENTRERWSNAAWRRDDNRPVMRGRVLARERKR